MIVNGDIVFVDGWQFEIIRGVPQIGASLGKGEPNEQIKINLSQTVSSDYVKSTIKVEIEYEGEIAYIKIAGEEVEVPQKQDGKYMIEKEVTSNGTYSVLVKDTEEKYQIASIKVSDITEDMDIWTKADMELFRDRVNSGRTYEGRTVRLMADIDLQGSEENQWTPIGDYGTDTTHYFAGTFEGNNHNISSLYINSTLTCQGLFGMNQGTIQNVEVQGELNGGSYLGMLGGRNNGNIIKCISEGTINSVGITGGIVGINLNGNIKRKY